MTIRLLHNVGNDLEGAVLHVSEDRARRLIIAGYAVKVDEQEPPKPKRTKKDQ